MAATVLFYREGDEVPVLDWLLEIRDVRPHATRPFGSSGASALKVTDFADPSLLRYGMGSTSCGLSMGT